MAVMLVLGALALSACTKHTVYPRIPLDAEIEKSLPLGTPRQDVLKFLEAHGLDVLPHVGQGVGVIVPKNDRQEVVLEFDFDGDAKLTGYEYTERAVIKPLQAAPAADTTSAAGSETKSGQ